MKLKVITGIMLTLLLTSMLSSAFNIQPVKAESTTWTVDDDGPADFSTIQVAVDAAYPGDTIYVNQGTYNENIVVDKTLSIMGENWKNTFIDGAFKDTVVYVTANNVVIKGFTVQNSGYVALGAGIILWSSNNTISGNDIRDNEVGVIVRESNNNTIFGNDVTNNDIGVLLDWSSFNTVTRNNLANNTWSTFTLYSSSNNSIHHNNFINNTERGYSYNSTNVWDDGYPSGGNYWSDYEEKYPDAEELDGSGIWDTPYVIDENNQDNYPLVNPWTPTPLLTESPWPMFRHDAQHTGRTLIRAQKLQPSDGHFKWEMRFLPLPP